MITLNINKDNNNINLKANICNNEILTKYMDFNYFTGLCKDGCPHYNLSYTCPPNSPKFDDYTKDFKKSLVIAMYMSLDDDNTINDVHPYLRRVLSDLLIPLEKEFDGLLTDGGRCRYCEQCAYVDSLPCRFPDKIRFSMEAMGINLDKVCSDILDHCIMWNEDDENRYCTVLGSINFNGNLNENDFKEAILKLI
jgi:predicted metal-binding protein